MNRPKIVFRPLDGLLLLDKPTGMSSNAALQVARRMLRADKGGHTGSLEATIAAVETLDECLGRILKALERADGTAIITADHGNAEQMWDTELNAPHTAHTSNPVPVILCHERFVGSTLRDGSLRDVAPTMLELLKMEKAPEMTGRSLLEG